MRRLVRAGAALEDKGAGGRPLYIAAGNGHVAALRFLLEQRADVNARYATGATALHDAAENGHTECCLALLEFEADINSKSYHRETPLKKAMDAGHTATADALRAAGGAV